MNRRGFLSLLAGAAVAAADPEQLLWKPKLISIPKPFAPIQLGFDYTADPFIGLDLEAFDRRYLRPAMQAIADKVDQQCLHRYKFAEIHKPNGVHYGRIIRSVGKLQNVRHIEHYDSVAQRFRGRFDVTLVPR